MSLDFFPSYHAEKTISRPRRHRHSRSSSASSIQSTSTSSGSCSPLSLSPSRSNKLKEIFEGLNTEIQDVHTLLLGLDASLKAQKDRTSALEKSIAKACQQLEDHDVYFPARYPPSPPPTTDLWERRKKVEACWARCRIENAGISKPTDHITPLPYVDDTYPARFPHRLAGLLTLRERQVEGFLYGYGQEPPNGSVDAKRRRLAAFIGIDPMRYEAAAQHLSGTRRRGDSCAF